MSNDEIWMRVALDEARLALTHGDAPIGAVAVYQGEAIGRGHNRREIDHDPTAHAEIIAIRQAGERLGHWRLDGVTLYCTLEPCCMCAGAMVLARLPRLVYAAIDPKAGCAGSVLDVLRHSQLNHRVDIDVGLYADAAAELLQTFFQNLRD
jgi:tRNA(adenine34) deaminase